MTFSGTFCPLYFSDRRLLQPAQVCDILKGVILVICYFMMHYVDYSMMYHLIRGQSVIKLYIIYNMLEVRMLASECQACFFQTIKYCFITVSVLRIWHVLYSHKCAHTHDNKPKCSETDKFVKNKFCRYCFILPSSWSLFISLVE